MKKSFLSKRKYEVLILVLGLFPYLASGKENEKSQEKVKLGEVVVTPIKLPRTVEDVPVKTEVIGREEIEESNAKNVGEIIKEVPGVYIRGENVPGNSSWRSTMRGLHFDSGYVLILIDGERSLGGGMGEYGISVNQIPPEMIERIEVIKGPVSSLYGSDGLAGVVNVITREPPETPIFSVNAECGNYGITSFGAFYGRKIKKLTFLVNAQRETSLRGRYGAREDNFRGNYVLSKLSYSLSKRFSLLLNAHYNHLRWNYTTEEKFRVSPSLKAVLKDGSLLRFKGYWHKLNLHLFSPGYTERMGDINYFDIELLYSRPLMKNHVLTFGVEYLKRDINANFADEEDSFASFYLQGEVRFDPVNIILGGRFDDSSLYGSEFNPKLAVMWKIIPDLKLRASAGRGFKSPTIRQLYVSFKHGNWWNKPNPDLKPEIAWSYSVGIDGKLLKKLFFSLEGFRTEVRNIIVRVETDEKIEGVPVRTWQNVQKASIQGIEMWLKAEVTKYFSFDVAYTYLYTKNKTLGKELPDSPPHTVNGRVTFRVPQWELFASWSTAFMDRTFKDEENTSKVNFYSLSNFNITKELTRDVDVSLEVDNVFESDYGEPEKEWLGRVIMGRIRIKSL